MELKSQEKTDNQAQGMKGRKESSIRIKKLRLDNKQMNKLDMNNSSIAHDKC